jgi:outer membrane protein assembly factor BamE
MYSLSLTDSKRFGFSLRWGIIHAHRHFGNQLIMRVVALGAILASALLLSACNNFEFPFVYRLPIDQGNVVKQDMIDQLQPGMSKEQVQFVMGTPMIASTFREDRWDYLFSLQRGNDILKQYRLSVFFKEDQLVNYTGNFKPTAAGGKDIADNPDVDNPDNYKDVTVQKPEEPILAD